MIKRPTLLLTILVLALAFRPGQPIAETAPGGQAAEPPGRITGTVTKAGTADALAEVQIIVIRGATAAPVGPRQGGARAGLQSRPAPQARTEKVEAGFWSWAGLPTAAARGGPGVGLAAQRGAANQLRATTDANGQFIIENVAAGPYVVTAQLEGYFAPATPGAPSVAPVRANVTVTAGKMTEINLSLIPGGAIAGRVVDPRGRPVVDTPVQALRLTYQADGSSALQGAGNRPTDDRGEYRLFRLPPGEYYLVANPRQVANAVNAADPNARETQSRTFYPAALTPALGAPVVIRGGEDFNGVNIQIRNIPLANVSGRVLNALQLSAFDPIPAQRGPRGQQPVLAAAAAADPSLQPLIDEVNKAQTAVQDAQSIMQEARGRLQEARGLRGAPVQAAARGLPAVQLQLFPRERNALTDPNTGNRSATAQLALPNDGHFEFPSVPPGSYELFASLPDNNAYGPQHLPGQGNNGRSFGRVSIDVGDADISDIAITVHPGVDVHGRVIVDGHPEKLTGAHIVLQPDDASSRINNYQQVGRSEAQIADDGSFTIPAVPEAAYRLQVTLGGPGPAARGNGGVAGLDQATIQELLAQVQAGGDAQALLADARGRAQTANAASIPNAYVADVRQNGVTIYDSGIVIGSGPTGLIDVFVQSSAAGIAGTVMGPDQKPAAATVVLVPPPARRRNQDLYRTATAGEDGTFKITGLPPGEYKLFAFRNLNGSPYLNPDFIRLYEQRGSAISIFAGGQTTAEVTLIAE